MLTLILFSLSLTSSYGHTNRVQSEADLQSALMPQELNPAFVPEKFSLMTDDQWNAVMPLPRTRRYTEIGEPLAAQSIENTLYAQSPVGEHVKHYGRVVAFVVLIISAVSEIVLYCIGVYYSS